MAFTCGKYNDICQLHDGDALKAWKYTMPLKGLVIFLFCQKHHQKATQVFECQIFCCRLPLIWENCLKNIETYLFKRVLQYLCLLAIVLSTPSNNVTK